MNEASQRYNAVKFFLKIFRGGLIFSFAALTLFEAIFAIASFTQNDNAGTFRVDFNGNQQGIVSQGDPLRSNIDVDVVAGKAKLSSGAGSGFFTTASIQPASFDGWNKIKISPLVMSTANDIKGSLYTCDPSPILVSGFSVPAAFNSAKEIDISGLSATLYPCLRVRIDMAKTTGASPELDWVEISWDPLPVFLVTQSAPTDIEAGLRYSVAINYSVSFVDSNGTVVWAAAPRAVDGTITNFTSGYLQNPAVNGVTGISNGGIYTSSGTTVNGVVIPANSVYWNLGKIGAGQSGTLTYQLQTINGWENGMHLLTQAHIQSTLGDEALSDADPSTLGADPTVTIIESVPQPSISKTVSGVVVVDGQNYVVSAQGYSSVVTYNVTYSNSADSSKVETIFNPVITDDVSDVMNKLSVVCGVTNPASRFSNFSPAYSSFSGTNIIWDNTSGALGHIAPGSAVVVSYDVDYTDCPNGPTKYLNVVAGTSDLTSAVNDSEDVMVGLDLEPRANVAKGDEVYGVTSTKANTDDNANKRQPGGDTFSYTARIMNNGAVAYGDIVLADKIPAGTSFVSATFPTGVTGSLNYYNKNGSQNTNAPGTPPSYTIQNQTFIGTGWATNYASTSDVGWVAFYIKCLNSPLFPADNSSPQASCVGAPSSITVKITVKIDPLKTACEEAEMTNKITTFVHAASPTIGAGLFEDLDTPIHNEDNEPTHAGPAIAILSESSTVTGPANVQNNNVATYTFTVANTGNDTALGAVLTIPIPPVTINGTPGYLNFVSATGGTLNTVGLPASISMSLGNIQAGVSKNVVVKFSIPPGIPNGTKYNVTGTVAATDDYACAPITATFLKKTSVQSLPKLTTFKNVSESVISPLADIHYDITFKNTGAAPTTNTYVIDHVPSRTVFKEAYTSGVNGAGTTFSCTGCSVYFSTNTTNLPANLSVTSAITPAIIAQYFTLGVQSSPGVWIPAGGVAPSSIKWVAWKVDDATLPTAVFPTGTTEKVGMTVTNDDNGSLPGSIASPIGTILSNAPAIFSNELIQAIDRQVFTTILPDPGLRLIKTSSVDYVSAGEQFDWNIQYYNDSGNPDSDAVITDTLPSGINVVGIYNTWNHPVGLNTGWPETEYSIMSDTTNVQVVGNVVTIRISNKDNPTAGIRGGPLLTLEGGTIRLRVAPIGTLTSNEPPLVNEALGCFENPSASYCITVQDDVNIANPDLWIRKFVDITDPVAGETIGYTLVVTNIGPHAADHVLIRDTLPAGLCYVSGTTSVTTAGWTLPEPNVSGSCGSAQVLEWDNVISGPFGVGVMPGFSSDVYIRYNVKVHDDVPPGTTLTNGAHIETPLIEDDLTNNDTGRDVTTPLPNPKVVKSVAPTVLPGDNADFSITYQNTTKEAAHDVYIIDTFPDYDNDGTPDMKFVNSVSVNNEKFYYHAGPIGALPPTFDPLNPTANGWKQVATGIPAYVAILIKDLPANAGPYSPRITLSAIDPDTNANIPAGVSLTNLATIFTSSLESDTLDNTSSATTTTPGIDLTIEKSGLPEGGFPGVAPGDPIVYSIKIANSGSVDACAVYVTDTFSANLNEGSPIEDFSTTGLSLIDSFGLPVLPNDATGSPIGTPVSVSFIHTSTGNFKWILGNPSGNNGDDNVCMPPGSSQTFHVNAIASASAPDETLLSNAATVGEDSAAVEDIMTNNSDSSSTVVYKPDLFLTKTGLSCGADNLCGNGDDSTLQTSLGEEVQYTITYGNQGSGPAKMPEIIENIPPQICFKVGSINAPVGTTILYSINNGASYSASYYPVADAKGNDCAVTNFKVAMTSDLPSSLAFGEDASFSNYYTSSTNLVVEGTSDQRLKLDSSSFAEYTEVPTAYGLWKPTAVDVNNDSFKDIVLPGSPNGGVYLNNSSTGTMSFDTTPGAGYYQLPLPYNGGNVVAEDISGDGKVDFVTPFYVVENTTADLSPTITVGATITLGGNLGGSGTVSNGLAMTADFDDDGQNDILVASDTSVSIFRNTSSGGVLSIDIDNPITFSGFNALSISDIKISDFNEDNLPDVYIVGEGVYENTTSGGPIQFESLTSPSVALVGNTGSQNIVHDFNTDGKEDIVLMLDATNEAEVYENTSNGSGISFVLVQTLAGVYPYGRGLAVDLDSDSLDDLVLGSDTSGTHSVYKNTTSGGNLSFGSAVPLVGPESTKSMGGAADLDSDGKVDLFLLGVGGTYNIYRNITPLGSSTLAFSPAVLPMQVVGSSNGENVDPILYDFDKNGKVDIFMYSYVSGAIIENDSIPGVITLGKRVWLPNDYFLVPPLVEDFDQDTWVDVVSPSYFKTYAFRNNSTLGNVSFGSSSSYIGVYTAQVSMQGGMLGWDKLRVKQDVPQGASLTYGLYDQSCAGTPLLSPTALPNNFIDISSLPLQNMCLKVTFTAPSFNNSPILDGWQVTYDGTNDLQVFWRGQVKNSGVTGASVDNLASINTTSDEIDTSNNSDTFSLSLDRVDVEVVKTVDKASALPGDTLTYTLAYQNYGPIDAHNVTLEDQLPANFAFDSYTVLTGDPLACTLDSISNKLTCTHATDLDWVLSAGETGSLTIMGIIVPGLPPTVLTHSTQSEFEAGDVGSYYSTTAIPGSVVADNVTVPIDLSATSIPTMNLQVTDSTGTVVESCLTDPSVPSTCTPNDLVEFSVTSLSPLTLHYTGGASVDISSLLLNMEVAGGAVDNYSLGLIDTDGDQIADTYYTSTNYGAIYSGAMSGAFDFTQDMILKLESPGYGVNAQGGTTVIPANADYQNSFSKGSSTCPSGVSPTWGTLSSLDTNTDSTNTINILISSDGGSTYYPYDLSGAISIKDTLLSAGANDDPNTLSYVAMFVRQDAAVSPELQSVSAELVCPAGAVLGDTLTNTTHISTTTQDIDLENNDDTVTTTLGDYANVYVNKTGPTQANINTNFTYTINFGNNGNVPATNVQIVDTFGSDVDWVSDSISGASMSCSHSGQTVTCGGTGTTLAAGQIGQLLITVHVHNDNNLLLTPTIIPNVVDISTTSAETNIGDNHDEYNVPIAPLGSSSISGFVYVDTDADNQKQTSELGVQNIDVYLAGKDIFGRVYGPDKTAAPQIYETLMQELVSESLILPGAYLFTDPYPINYLPINPSSSSASGAWSFSGYNPGTYSVMIDQPANYTSTGSNAGYRAVTGSGTPILQPLLDGEGSFETANSADSKWITGIIMGEAENAIHYDFGELDGAIGDLVFWDKNSDGTYSGADTGLAGVTVDLVRDVDADGVIDAGEPRTTRTTDAGGHYTFTGLLIGQAYIVTVTDTGGVLPTYSAILGPNSGADNNAQNPAGYAVTLSVGASVNMTADFGYTKEDDDTGCTEDCGGGGSDPDGTIGNQVFLDANVNGIFDVGEQGIPGVGVMLYIDINKNGAIDPSEPSLPTIFTRPNTGQYEFDDLDPDKSYIVRINDVNNILVEYTPTVGANPGADNYSKNPLGYAVTLTDTSAGRVNMTADFGYAADILPPTGQAINIHYLLSFAMMALLGGVLYAFKSKPKVMI